MSGRHGHSAPEGQDDQQDILEEEAIHTARVIAGLRLRLLQNPEALKHPKVRNELQLFDEQLAGQLAYSDGGRGRHRSIDDGAIGPHINDASENELKPNPHSATTPAAFIEALRQYRVWSGNPPWRMMAERANQAVVFSTMYNAMKGDELPKLHVVRAIVTGCGGNEADVISFVNAWRRIEFSKVRDRDWIPRQSDE